MANLSNRGKQTAQQGGQQSGQQGGQEAPASNISLEQLMGVGTGYSAGHSTSFNELETELKELIDKGATKANVHVGIMKHPDLNDFGSALAISMAVGGKVYMTVGLDATRHVDVQYEVGTGNQFNPETATVSKPVETIVAMKNSDGKNPFLAIAYSYCLEQGLLDKATSKEEDVIIANNFPLGAEASAQALLSYSLHDIGNSITATTGVHSQTASDLNKRLQNELTVEMLDATDSIKDALGNPSFNPVAIRLSQAGTTSLGGKSRNELAELRGFVDVLPVPNREEMQQQLAQQNNGYLPNINDVPRLRPVLVLSPVEWMSTMPSATSEGMKLVLGITSKLFSNPEWLRACVAERKNSAYDFASVGYYAQTDKDGNDIAEPVGAYHDRAWMQDAGQLQAHIKQFFTPAHIALDIPRSGHGKTVMEGLVDRDTINRDLQTVFGPDAVLLQGSPTAGDFGPIPYGSYRDNGIEKGTNALLNVVSAAGIHKGDRNAINEVVNTLWQFGGETQYDKTYAKRLELLNDLAGGNSVKVTAIRRRVMLSRELIEVLFNNLQRNRTIKLHTVEANRSGNNVGANWADGFSHGGGSGNGGSITNFTGWL